MYYTVYSTPIDVDECQTTNTLLSLKLILPYFLLLVQNRSDFKQKKSKICLTK